MGQIFAMRDLSFDADFYLHRYPDVAASWHVARQMAESFSLPGGNAANFAWNHWLSTGAREGRDPAPPISPTPASGAANAGILENPFSESVYDQTRREIAEKIKKRIGEDRRRKTGNAARKAPAQKPQNRKPAAAARALKDAKARMMAAERELETARQAVITARELAAAAAAGLANATLAATAAGKKAQKAKADFNAARQAAAAPDAMTMTAPQVDAPTPAALPGTWQLTSRRRESPPDTSLARKTSNFFLIDASELAGGRFLFP